MLINGPVKRIAATLYEYLSLSTTLRQVIQKCLMSIVSVKQVGLDGIRYKADGIRDKADLAGTGNRSIIN